MASHFYLSFQLILISLFLFSGCVNGDYCLDSELDQNIEVDFYFYGNVHFYDENNQDITSSYVGSNFLLQFSKIKCDGSYSPYFYYDYVLKEDGKLFRYQNTPYSFTMENEEDHFELIFHFVHENGSIEDLTPTDTFAYYEEWKSGKVQAEVTINFYHSDPENSFLGAHDLIIEYK